MLKLFTLPSSSFTAHSTAECQAEFARWHAQEPEAVLAALGARREGLTQEDAALRMRQYGANVLPPTKKRGAVRRFLDQFHHVLIYVLLGATVITAWLGHGVDAAVILGVVLINAVIGYIQEHKAEQAMDAICRMLPLRTQVVRDGQRKELDAEALVPGDVVFVSSGDKIPADMRLIEVHGLYVGEAMLTGESQAVPKQVAAVHDDSALGDRTSMVYSGTLVTQGQGIGVVVATGAATELGQISAMLAQTQSLTTPLLKTVAEFGRWLTCIILAVAALLFAFGTLARGYAASDMFLAAVGLAVAAIPEGLPAIMTIALALGVQRMARRRAIVRRLPAIEALGAVTVICSDKTGTLTRNEMTVQQVITADAIYEVSGTGYAPCGAFALNGKAVDATCHPQLRELARAVLLCNDASLRHEDGAWLLSGDPTEGALITLALKACLDPRYEQEALPRVDAIPFESEHRFMASLHHDHAGRRYVFLKGAPERVLELCAFQREAGLDRPIQHAQWGARMEAAAQEGMRLLAIATRKEPPTRNALDFSDVQRGGFTLLALLGIADPPREEAMRAVAACRSAGIRIKMITGDHAATAAAIGRRLGLAEHIQVINGASLDRMTDAELQASVGQIDVFARASPQHKLRLMHALQAQGEVVAMTGDGVNDAPALKRADVGVAMGCKGTEAAKEAAEIVLADDNFATIAAAVEEGRVAYDNIRKAITFVLPTNCGEACMVLVAILLGIQLPITPMQILWVNMITAVTLSLALAFEHAEQDIMRRPPRAPNQPLLSGFLVWRIVFVSLLLVAGSLGLFLWELEQGATLEVARTAAVNALVMGEIMYLFNCRHLSVSALSINGMLGNRYVLSAIGMLLALQMLLTYLPAMQSLFSTAALDGAAWGRIVMFGGLLMLLVEAEKYLFRHRAASVVTRLA